MCPVHEQLLAGTALELKMPVQARRDGDSLLFDNVDLKRLARSLLQKVGRPGWQPPERLTQWMELVAQGCGFPTLLEANLRATTELGAASMELPHDHESDAARHALGRGEVLPPPWPNGDYHHLLFCTAVSNPFMDDEIAAIVGPRGTGKTDVCNILVANLGAKKVDLGAYNWRDQLNAACNGKPNVIILKRLYAHGAPKVKEILLFFRYHMDSNIVFVFDELASLLDLLEREALEGGLLFRKAHVLDTQTYEFGTVVPDWPPSERSPAHIEGTAHAKPTKTAPRTNGPAIKSLRRTRP